MTKVTIIAEGAKINYQPYAVGTVMDIADELVDPWLKTGLIVIGEQAPNPAPEPPAPPKTVAAKKVEK